MSTSKHPVIVAAPDSFKGSVSAREAAAAMALGARDAYGPGAEIIELPLADGGEGTLDALLAVWDREPLAVETTDALGRPCTARYGISADGRTGIIEAAEANGLPQVGDVPLQPLRADTRGVGVIAARLLDAGVEEVLLCIGGSATTDGGTGFLTALGVRFLDDAGKPVAPGGGGLSRIASVDAAGLHPRARQVTWRIAVDVDNPLCGPLGAAAVFGPQKGAQPGDIAALDAGLSHLAAVLAAEAACSESASASAVLASTGTSTYPATSASVRASKVPTTFPAGPAVDAVAEGYRQRPGFGAAGGLPLALAALLGAETVPGAELVGEAIGLRDALARADVVLTGEGSLDSQSLGGKVVDAVRRTAPASCPVIVVAGTVQLSARECREAGITAAFSIARGAASLQELQADAADLIRDAAAQACAALAYGPGTRRSVPGR